MTESLQESLSLSNVIEQYAAEDNAPARCPLRLGESEHFKLLVARRTDVHSLIAKDGFAGSKVHRTLDRVQNVLCRPLSTLRLAVLGCGCN
jgi:hypothetical protein